MSGITNTPYSLLALEWNLRPFESIGIECILSMAFETGESLVVPAK